jgi:hypothetical protein
VGLRLLLDLPDVICISCKMKTDARLAYADEERVSFNAPAGWHSSTIELREPNGPYHRVELFLCTICARQLIENPARGRIVQRDPT